MFQKVCGNPVQKTAPNSVQITYFPSEEVVIDISSVSSEKKTFEVKNNLKIGWDVVNLITVSITFRIRNLLLGIVRKISVVYMENGAQRYTCMLHICDNMLS